MFCLWQKRCADGAMCACGTLRIYLSFGDSQNITSAVSRNITLTKSKYNLHCKYNLRSKLSQRKRLVLALGKGVE